MSGSDSISPTAHYTGYVWSRNGLSTSELATTEGRLLFDSLHPLMLISGALGRPSLESYLLARHRAVDALLERAIEDDRVTQVIEVAAGLSPRGWRFARRYGERLTYIEADLPAMADRKRKALARAGSLGDRHRVCELDALEDEGLAALAAELDREQGLAILTEGLLGYISTAEMEALWRRFATTLERFATGRYISDLHLGGAQTVEVRVFRLLLSAFVRGQVHLHFADAVEAEAAVREAGFRNATVRRANEVLGQATKRGAQMAHILEASTV
ncbi:MAG: class I SAM-dependent methyltransferase [Solirubrobacteraceae bacterium]